MKPILFYIGDFPFSSWYFFFAIACITGYIYFQILLNKIASFQLRENGYFVFIICYFSGLLGARLLSIITERESTYNQQYFHNAILSIFEMGSLTFYGSILGASIGGIVYCYYKKISLHELFITGIPPTLLGLGIGRIGCYLNGDDYGKPIPSEWGNPWWSAIFPNLQDNIPRYPTQLLESAIAISLGIFGGIWLIRNSNSFQKLPKKSSILIVLITFSYAFARVFLETLRDDARGILFGFFTPSQEISLVIMFASIAYFLFYTIKK